MNKKLKIDDRTVVYCTTEYIANKVLNIAENLGFKWCNGDKFSNDNKFNDYKSKTCYHLIEGRYSDLQHCAEFKYNIISAEEFIKLHTMDKNIYIECNGFNNKQAVDYLEKIGGIDRHKYVKSELAYVLYIGKDNIIRGCIKDSHEYWLLTKAFVKYVLSEPRETIVIGGNTYYKDEFEKAVKNLKPVK